MHVLLGPGHATSSRITAVAASLRGEARAKHVTPTCQSHMLPTSAHVLLPNDAISKGDRGVAYASQSTRCLVCCVLRGTHQPKPLLLCKQ